MNGKYLFVARETRVYLFVCLQDFFSNLNISLDFHPIPFIIMDYSTTAYLNYNDILNPDFSVSFVYSAAIVKVYILSYILYPASYPANKLYPILSYPILSHQNIELRLKKRNLRI